MPTKSSRGKIIVLKLSGSLFFSEDFESVARLLKEVVKKRKSTKLVIVAGGARVARVYIRAAQELGADQVSQDELGIQASRLNAIVLSMAVGNESSTESYTTISDLANGLEVSDRNKRVFVIGGIQPGQSTNAAAALAAEKLGADLFVNATDVGGVYTRDPKRFKNSKLLSKVRARKLASILDKQSMKAGAYDLMDPVALKIIERSKIKTRIVSCDEGTLRSVLLSEKKIGTEIIS
jgi:uridylate kinase